MSEWAHRPRQRGSRRWGHTRGPIKIGKPGLPCQCRIAERGGCAYLQVKWRAPPQVQERRSHSSPGTPAVSGLAATSVGSIFRMLCFDRLQLPRSQTNMMKVPLLLGLTRNRAGAIFCIVSKSYLFTTKRLWRLMAVFGSRSRISRPPFPKLRRPFKGKLDQQSKQITDGRKAIFSQMPKAQGRLR